MRRINTILVFFLLFFSALTAAGWAFIQSKAFGRLLSKAITEISSKKFDTNVRFSRLSVKFFPPGLALENVSLEYKRKGTSVSAEAGELGVLFDVTTFQNEQFKLREVFVKECNVDLEIPKEESANRHPWDVIQSELAKLPVKIGTLAIHESRVNLLAATLDVSRLVVSPTPKKIIVDGELKHLKYGEFKSSIDLFKLNGVVQRDSISADKLLVIQKRSKVAGSGSFSNWADPANGVLTLKYNTDVFLPDLYEWIDTSPIAIKDGLIKASGKLSWSSSSSLKIETDFEATSFHSNVVTAKTIKGTLYSSDKEIILQSLELRNDEEKLTLIAPAIILDIKNKKILPGQVLASLDGFELGNALTFLGESLKPLRGRLSGDMSFRLKDNDLFFYPRDGFRLNNLRLEFPKSDGQITRVINAPNVWLSSSVFSVVKGAFEMTAKVKAPRTQFDVVGRIDKRGVSFDVGPGPISAIDFGDIAGLGIKGEGLNSIRVNGPLDSVSLNLEGEFKSFEILGYRLGDTNHKIEVNLNKGSVDISHFKAKKGRYEYSGTGLVNFKQFLIDLSIDIPNLSYAEFKDAINPISGGLSFLPPDFSGYLQGNVEILAKNDISNLMVGADVYAQKITAYDESFRDSKFTFLYSNKKISLKEFSVTKEDGRIFGQIGYDLPLKRLDYQLSMRDLNSKELLFYKKLPMAVEFKAVGEFQGYQTISSWNHRGYLGISQAKLGDKPLEDSTFEWEIRNDSVSVDAKILKDWIVLSSTSESTKGHTEVTTDVSVDIPDLPLFMRAFLGENNQLTNATGDLSIYSRFKIRDWEWNKIDAESWLKRLRLVTNEISLQQTFSRPQVKIVGGNVQVWNVKLDSSDLRLTSKAEGDFRNNLVINNYFDFDAKYLELASKHIQRADGRVTSVIRNILSPSNFKVEFESQAKELSLNTDLLPFTLNSLNYKLNFKDRELEFESISFRPDSGKASASGSIIFNGFNPDVNIRLLLDRAAFPIKNKSDITVSGDGLIFGNRPPYVINGELEVNKGSFLNELSDFTNQSSTTNDVKFLPRESDGQLAGIFNLDLAIRTENPIVVINSLMDVSLLADLRLTGDVLRPAADGRVHSPPTGSKVFFKNNEYQISKAEFAFSSRKPLTKPEFDIAANSTIANYKLTAKAFGNPESFTFDLSSDPALSKQNILSLIAFGYTEDLSNTITAQERQDLTRVGVGSFIFDQFKVTDIVKKQFGLQLNLGTVFEQAETSMLSGRSQEQAGTGTLARTRTATNIEVKKRLSEAMSLSVSSTVGGSIGQRQKMNLNYGINKNVQLEGVYELRTNAEGTEDIIDNSVGGDVKFRMTFK